MFGGKNSTQHTKQEYAGTLFMCFHEQKHMNSDMKLSVTASDVCLVSWFIVLDEMSQKCEL